MKTRRELRAERDASERQLRHQGPQMRVRKNIYFEAKVSDLTALSKDQAKVKAVSALREQLEQQQTPANWDTLRCQVESAVIGPGATRIWADVELLPTD